MKIYSFLMMAIFAFAFSCDKPPPGTVVFGGGKCKEVPFNPGKTTCKEIKSIDKASCITCPPGHKKVRKTCSDGLLDPVCLLGTSVPCVGPGGTENGRYETGRWVCEKDDPKPPVVPDPPVFDPKDCNKDGVVSAEELEAKVACQIIDW